MARQLNMLLAFKLALLVLAISQSIGVSVAKEELVTTAHEKNGDTIPYILNYKNLSPNYALILFPGGNGIVDPHIKDGKLVYKLKGNFLLRARPYFVDDEFVTVATDSTQSEERIQAIIDDLKQRFPKAKIYLVGTSNGTFDTLHLASYLSDKIAGEIHTSSLSQVAQFDAKKFANRQLIVHHRHDQCRSTPFSSAENAHDKYGDDFIAMDGGISEGDYCEAFAHHGYNGIEEETVDAIKKWIKQGAG